MIPKKIHYIWFGKGKKPENFQNFLNSWKKFCPDYEIIEWNEQNYNIEKNQYLKKFYEKGDFAFASDYARFDIIYEHGGIYLDVDIELLKNLDELLENKGFTGFQDNFYIGGGIFGAEKGNPILKEILDFYEKRNKKIIITFVFENILKKFRLKKYDGKTQVLENFTIYKKEYFYPYSFFEKSKKFKISENTFAIHHFNASWLPKIFFVPTIFIFKILNKFHKKN